MARAYYRGEAEATDILGIIERTFRRWSGCYDTDRAEGLPD
jgi:hypothetical protein